MNIKTMIVSKRGALPVAKWAPVRVNFATLALGTALLTGACQPDRNTPSSTHWVSCNADADCLDVAQAAACTNGYCVDNAGSRIVLDDGAGAASASGGGDTGGRTGGGGASTGGGSSGGGDSAGGGAASTGGAGASGGEAGATGTGGASASGPCYDEPCDGICEGSCAEGFTCSPPGNIGCTQALTSFCGCDGETFTNSDGCPHMAFANAGACEAPSASNCDTRDITCLPIVPVDPCPEGQAYTVVDGCYGECVPVGECGCSVADECPDPEGTKPYGCYGEPTRCGPWLE